MQFAQRIGLLWLLGLLLLGGCQDRQQDKTVTLNGLTMGTTWSVRYLPGEKAREPASVRQKLQANLDRINALMSTYDPQSELSRFNDVDTKTWFDVSAETAEVVNLALQISRLTGGAFDVTVGPLVDLWGFGPAKRQEQVPDDLQIQEALKRIGYLNLQVRLQPPALRKLTPQLRIDLSAIAKGYAVDVLAELLKSEGIENFLVEIGGEMRISGARFDGTPWRIAIEKPLEGKREVETIFPLGETAVATSGNYRNFYVENGQRYAHTIDPKTGRPAKNRMASVTVLDLTCARADALATALMVMGERRGRQFCERNRIPAFFLIHDGDRIVESSSPAFSNLLQEQKK